MLQLNSFIRSGSTCVSILRHIGLNVSWCLTDFFSFRMAPPDTECPVRLQVRDSPQEADAHPQTEAHGCHTVHSSSKGCSRRRLPVPNQKSRGGNIPFSSFFLFLTWCHKCQAKYLVYTDVNLLLYLQAPLWFQAF